MKSWYSKPVELRKPLWSKPYFDKDGGDVWMITYSIPIYSKDANKKLLGVLTNNLLVSKK